MAFRFLLPGLAVAVLATACTSGPSRPVDDRSYEERVQAGRAEKDAYFRQSDQSPLLPEDRATFAGLPYYPIDPALRVPARLTAETSATPVVIEMQMSDDTFERFRKVGTLSFALGEDTHRLTAFASESDRAMARLFLPFRDQTSGVETYGGGRYLELDRTPTGLYDLDFNRAYHPYCVYNVSWVCPVPPQENRLAVAVRAGERLPLSRP